LKRKHGGEKRRGTGAMETTIERGCCHFRGGTRQIKFGKGNKR